jgi:hypothetical protein
MSKSKFVVVGPLLGKMFPSNLSIWLVARQNVSAQSINRIVKRTMYEYANYSHILLKYGSLNLTFIITRSINVQHGSDIFSIIIY